MKKILIYTGPVHSGKTTSLFQWIYTQKNVKGILQPVIDDKRFTYQIATRTLKILETSSDKSEEIVNIGKYKFSLETFLWAQKILLEDFKNDCEWLVIDEVGPLELNGKGLEPAISKIISDREKFSGNILCVVREEMLDRFIEHYELQNSYQKIDL
jgi:nucleoside-triphosphatase THEP1